MWVVGLGVQGQKLKRSGQRPWGTEQRPLGQGAAAGGCVWVCSWHMGERAAPRSVGPTSLPPDCQPQRGKKLAEAAGPPWLRDQGQLQAGGPPGDSQRTGVSRRVPVSAPSVL